MLHQICPENLLPSVSERSSILGSMNCQCSSSIRGNDQPVRPAEIKSTSAIEAEIASRMVEYADMNDAAAQRP